MRILIIATNKHKSPYPVAPLGAATMVSAMNQQGYETDFLDLNFVANITKDVAKKVNDFAPDVIGVSIRNVDDCSYFTQKSYMNDAKEAVDAIKALSNDAVIIVGGSALSVVPANLAEFLGVKYAMQGEGEKNFPRFMEALQGNDQFEDIPGLLYKKDDYWVHNKPDFSLDLNDMPTHAYDKIQWKKYFNRGGFISLQSKRGCPLKCVYCNYATLEGTRIRPRSAQLVVDDIERIIAETGKRDFFFADSVFNFPVKHAMNICREIINRDIKIRWMAYCNPLAWTDEVARTFKASGCAGVELGVDAVSDKMIEKMGKAHTSADLHKCSEALVKAGLPFAIFMLFGGPDENLKDIEESQKILKNTTKANAIFASLGIRVYQDAPIYDIALSEGVVTKDQNMLPPTYFCSKDLGEDVANKLDRVARREFNWSTPTDWDNLFVATIQKAFGYLRVIPSWQNLGDYGKNFRRQTKPDSAQHPH